MNLPEDRIYTIGEAAKAVGVSISTLRRWDKEGKIKIGRKSNGYRAFTEAEVLLLKQTQAPQETVSNIPPPRAIQPYLRLSNHTRHLFLTLFILIFLLAIGNIFLLAKTDYPHQAVLGVETFVAPALEESAPLGSILSRIGGFFRNNPVSSFALTIVQKVEQPLSPDLNVQGKASIAKDIEGLGDLKIKGTGVFGKVVTGIVDPYLIENDGTVQSTLEIKSTGDIALEAGSLKIDVGGGSLSNVNNISSTGTVSSQKSEVSGDSSIGGTLTTSSNAVIGTSLETKKDLTVDGNITLSGVINSNTFSSTNLTFAGSSPSISAGTTNTGISLNGNGTGPISIGNSSKGDIYLGGGSTSTTYCLITNSSGSINCPGTATFGGATTLSSTLAVTGGTTLSSTLSVSGNTTLSGTLAVTGTGTLNGNVVLGASSSQTLAFNAKVTTSILPNLTGNVDLGSSSLKWNNLYSNTINTASINTSGQGIFNQNPASTAITDASLLINPTTVSNAGSALLGIAVGGVEKARIDETGKLTLQGGLNVQGGTVTLPSSSITVSSLTPGTAGQLLISNTTPQASFVTLSGDAILSGTGALTLANSGVTANTYGSTTAIPVITVDAKGRLTSVTTAAISSAWSSLTNPTGNLSLSMGADTTTFTYNSSTGASNLFTLTDSASNTGTGYLLSANTASLSTLLPFRVQARGNTIIDTTSTGGVTIGNATSAQAITIDAGTATLNLGNSNNAKTINIGTGTAADTINIGSGGTTADTITIGGLSTTAINTTGTITSTGNLLFGADNTYDIGASGANRPRNIYLAGLFKATGAATGFELWNNGSGTRTGYIIPGSSTDNTLYIANQSNNGMIFRTNDTDRWTIQAAGHLVASADNTYDIGASGATRPRNIYLGSSIYLPQDANAFQGIKMNGNIVMGGHTNGNIYFRPEVSGGNIYINSFGDFLNLFHITDTGDTFFHHLTTTAAAANAVVDATTGNLQRSTSSLRYKNLLGYLDLPGAQNIVLNAKPIVYTSKSKADNPNTIYVGFAAEQIATTDARFVTFDEQGLPNWVQYPSLTAPLTLIAQNHEKRILNLETETTNLLSTVGLTSTSLSASPTPTPTPTPSPTLTPPVNSILSRLDILEKSVLSASSSASFDSLTVLKKLLTNDLGITGNITSGLLSINGLDNSIASGSATINTISNDLYLQNLGVGGVNILAGKVTIDKNGNLTTQGNLAGNKLILTQSTNPSAGSATLPANSTSVNINTTAVTANSKIFLTATSSTGKQALIVGSQTPGTGFTVRVEQAYTFDITFNWWILDVK